MSYQEFRPRQFQQIPIVVKNILIINVVLFVISRFILTDVPFDRMLDLHYFKSDYFRPHQLITYLFMHGDISHLFLNMLGVYMFGSILESIWGPKRFLNFYLLCGLGAAAAQFGEYYVSELKTFSDMELYYDAYSILEAKQDFYNNLICLGASGSLFGLLVAFAMMFPNTYLHLYFVIPVKAKYLVIAYGLFELFSGFSNRGSDNVAHFAHLGGLLVGVIIMLIWKKNKSFFY